MASPLKAGDRAKVIGGMGRHKSPNLGIAVTVGVGDGGPPHRDFGPIVRCYGPDIQQLTDAGGYVKLGWGDFAVSWLEPAPDVPPALTKREKVVSHD